MPESLRLQVDRIYGCNGNWLGFLSNAGRCTEEDERLGCFRPETQRYCRQLPQRGEKKQDDTDERRECCSRRYLFGQEEVACLREGRG